MWWSEGRFSSVCKVGTFEVRESTNARVVEVVVEWGGKLWFRYQVEERK
jgi:hypothetical protein